MFYDSSAACDSFQLGEMVKFFVNKGFFAFTSPLLVNDEDYPEPYEGDIENLITALRQCPSYQYDKNHAHCHVGVGDRHRSRKLEIRAAEHLMGECGGSGTLPTYKERDDGREAQTGRVSDVERFVEEVLCGGQLGLDAGGMRNSTSVRVITG
ncbi:hypothetical protein V492_08222 [Pseudogymnoascus sp. VKM F-4246]|nr:hypothetical protein V492_08222 [Pseudogymnoascus sp. VKM F-4246]